MIVSLLERRRVMSDNEELIDVKVFPAIYDEKEEWMMMSYLRDGQQYITFTIEEGEGVWIPGPFPSHLCECEDCLEGLASNLADEGYILTHTPEQITMVA